tara:strand:+ start:2846 stop:3034 length:189 start_codon:yes stop_codon:yes gene_type:complete
MNLFSTVNLLKPTIEIKNIKKANNSMVLVFLSTNAKILFVKLSETGFRLNVFLEKREFRDPK